MSGSGKRPSPYRLIPVSIFLADFAPLHVKGWRLDNLPHVRHASQPKEGGMVELQDRHLTRRYDFDLGNQGWGDTLRFIQVIGEAIEAEDVSPPIPIPIPFRPLAPRSCIAPGNM